MDIRNVTQFANFLTAHGFQNLDGTLVQMVKCVENFSVACNCYKVEDKNRMYGVCCKLYMDSVRMVVPKIKHTILQKVPEGRISFFTDNGSLIAIVSR